MKDVKQVDINQIAGDDFISYALEVIKSRAIPNVEDNLKPVHRRVLYAMREMKLSSTAKHKKAATVVGETMKTHPHGDSSIYDALIRLSQPWKMRYPLIEIQGNGGSITGSPAAAQRYTETRLSPIGDLMLKDIDHAVDYMPTYDNESTEPKLLPSAFPNILCNGNMGIAVGMSSSLLPHNLKEAVDAITLMIKNPEATIDDILKVMPGPDLPTGGIIVNAEKVRDIYLNGSGTLSAQSKYFIETKGKNTHIVFTEVPYMVTINDIISKMKELALDGQLDDIQDIENNTGRNGIEIRVILKPKVNTNKVLQLLLEKTGLKNNLKIGMTVLKGESPIDGNIFKLINGYIEHRHNSVSNIYKHLKEKAEKRLHIVEGMIIATRDIDGVVDFIKNSASRDAAKIGLMKNYNLSDAQANAILDMKLSQLTKIDAYKLQEEEKDLIKSIEKYSLIINDKKSREDIIIKDLNEIKVKFGDARRTVLKNIDENEEVAIDHTFMVSLHSDSQITVNDVESISEMGKGKIGKKILSNTPMQSIQINSSSLLGCVTREGQIIGVPAKKLYAGEMIHLFDIDFRVKTDVVFIFEIKKEDLDKDILTIVTKNGLIKKTALSEYNNFKSLIYAVKLKEGDSVLYASINKEDDYIILTAEEKTLKYQLNSFATTGRNTMGMKAHDIGTAYAVATGSENDKIIMFDEDGAAKIVLIKDYMDGVRAGKGQVLRDNNLDIHSFTRTNAILIGQDLKGYKIDLNQIEIKSVKSQNTNIYGSKLSKIAI